MRERKIVYTNLQSPLGDMIAGATDNGVCFLEWYDRRGDIPLILERVTKRYRTTPVEGGSNNRHIKQLVTELARYFDGKLRSFDVRIDVTGTLFEQRVWKELLTIPMGETRTYLQIAKAVGKPGGSRAVGRANGANSLPIVIPCHRVIKTSGDLGGYGGKVWRKKRLLELEKIIL